MSDGGLRVVSWNVNGIRARWPRLSEMLSNERPDVVCLQETRCPDHAFPRERLRGLGYRSLHSAGRGKGGVAILVRSDLEASERNVALDEQRGLSEGRWLEVTIGDLTIGSVYVPAGAERDEVDDESKLAFLQAMANQAAKHYGNPLLIAGDFNVAPTDQDVYEPSWFEGSYQTGEAERADLQEILRGGDLVDVFRELHPEEDGYTCWDQREGHYARDYGLRIDLFLASQHLAPRVKRCEVNHEFRQGYKPSNHAPVEIELAAINTCAESLDEMVATGAGVMSLN